MKQRILLLLTAMLLVGASAKATNFISDLKVSTHEKEATAKSQLTSAGYTVIDQDLNEGGGGHYVYLGYKTSTNLADAITGLIVVSGSSYAGTENKTVAIDGITFQAVSYTSDSKGGNLNRGRGSSAADLYLYYTKYGNTTHASDSRWKPITGLAGVASTTERSKSSYPTYVRKYSSTYAYANMDNANLNQGGSASYYTYLNVTSTHVCSLAYAPTSIGSGTHKNYCTVCTYARFTASCTYGNWTVYSAEKCYRQCSVCSDREYATHNFPGVYINYSNTQHYTVCTYCSYKKYGDHNWGGWYQDNAYSHKHQCGYCGTIVYESHNWSYTCDNPFYYPNSHTKTCTVSSCGYSMKEDHTRVIDAAAVAATCTTAGSTEAYHCQYCSRSVAATTIAALGHQYGDYGVCTRTPGEKHYSHAQGDVTCDGETTLRDVSTLIYVVLNNLWANADYDNDGELSVSDIRALVNAVLGN